MMSFDSQNEIESEKAVKKRSDLVEEFDDSLEVVEELPAEND